MPPFSVDEMTGQTLARPGDRPNTEHASTSSHLSPFFPSTIIDYGALPLVDRGFFTYEDGNRCRKKRVYLDIRLSEHGFVSAKSERLLHQGDVMIFNNARTPPAAITTP
ncbi:uncharacterized protein ARMOST_02701 [Armillaria ostoyae]|uniref:Uncharacterized protein n=1 Tax=Armillaria ostoyae TaxID=47428 RepID=A0A284QSL8_ARMOS|nr:uncharacterized protein ARMOST_02701 [Armillaria ostoyae]